jgi:hypothetical protein
LLELASEVVGPLGRFEAQRVQGIDHAETTGIPPVAALDPDQGDDDRLRHSEVAAGALQDPDVLVPEPQAVGDLRVIYAQRFELIPGAAGRGR